MAKAELYRPRHAWTRTDGRRAHIAAHSHDHRLLTVMGTDRMAEEELVG